MMPETSVNMHEQHTNRQPIQMDYSNYQLYNPATEKKKEGEYNVQAYNK